MVTTWNVDFNAMENRDSELQGSFNLETLAWNEGAGRQGGHMTVVEDYQAVTTDYGLLKAGETLDPNDEDDAAKLDALLQDDTELVFLRIKNSWGSLRPDREFAPGFPGYHDLYFDYLNGPISWCPSVDDKTEENCTGTSVPCHGKKRPAHEPGSYLAEHARIDLAPKPLIDATARLESDFAREIEDRKRLKLISRRAIRTHNTWTHNLARFVAKDANTNYLYIHPADAERAGLSDGDLADVSSRSGTVRVPIRLLPELMEGVVALPHGWGHQSAKGLSVASRTTGVNVNLLAASGADAIESVSGMAHLTGIVVDVSPAAGPQNPRSWSGM